MLFAASLRAKAGAAANAAPSGMAGTLTASAPTKGCPMNEHGEEQMEPFLLCACKHANPGLLISGELLENAANADTSLAECEYLFLYQLLPIEPSPVLSHLSRVIKTALFSFAKSKYSAAHFHNHKTAIKRKSAPIII